MRARSERHLININALEIYQYHLGSDTIWPINGNFKFPVPDVLSLIDNLIQYARDA